MPNFASGLPRSVRTAALLLLAYGALVVINAWIAQSAAGAAESRDFTRALVRLAGCGLIAFGLMQAQRWAWWVAVVLGVLWAFLGAAAVLLLTLAGGWDRMGAGVPQVLLLGMAVLLGAAVVLLLQPASREAFR